MILINNLNKMTENSIMNTPFFYSYESSYEDPYFNSIGQYIIQKIREEDLCQEGKSQTEKESAASSNTDFRSNSRLQSRTAITELILTNKDIISNYKEFYEEECQLSLINWVKDIHEDLKIKKKKDDSLEDNYINKKNNLNKNQEILLYNIINIFEILPIKPDDLISLNFIDILKKIKKDTKNQNTTLYKKIKTLLNYWKSIISFYNKQDNFSTFLNKKQLRTKNEINLNNSNPKLNENKEEETSSLSLYETELEVSTKSLKIKKKKVNWKDDKNLKEEISYDPNEAPSMMENF